MITTTAKTGATVAAITSTPFKVGSTPHSTTSVATTTVTTIDITTTATSDITATTVIITHAVKEEVITISHGVYYARVVAVMTFYVAFVIFEFLND